MCFSNHASQPKALIHNPKPLMCTFLGFKGSPYGSFSKDPLYNPQQEPPYFLHDPYISLRSLNPIYATYPIYPTYPMYPIYPLWYLENVMAQVLLVAKADPFTQNARGQTALDVAKATRCPAHGKASYTTWMGGWVAKYVVYLLYGCPI